MSFQERADRLDEWKPRVAAPKQIMSQLVAMLCSDSRPMPAIRQVMCDCTMRCRMWGSPYSIGSLICC